MDFPNFKTGFSKTANEYISFIQQCNPSSPTGLGMQANLVLTNRSTQPPQAGQYTATVSIIFNNGFTSLDTDNFTALIQPGGMFNGTAGLLCALDAPVTYFALPDTTAATALQNSCNGVRLQSNFIAQLLFQQLKDSLKSNFDSIYRAKCLGAQSLESFYVSYQPSEYHYTLYYYDQAGNLVKTLPPAAVKPNFDATYLAQVQAARVAATDLSNSTNTEKMATQYRYNTLNQVMAQQSPDGGSSYFWYDRLGRLAISQNANQAAIAAYSYKLYDVMGRITEVGQKPQNTAMSQTISQDDVSLGNWLADLANGSAKQQITRTVYDIAYSGFSGGNAPVTQINLRNRGSIYTGNRCGQYQCAALPCRQFLQL